MAIDSHPSCLDGFLNFGPAHFGVLLHQESIQPYLSLVAPTMPLAQVGTQEQKAG